ncbi:MAG: hypothetical protein CMF46_05180 [Legionellales bacterium]|nr:hypothetical protein [Legionellales bacterium]|tara:strand:- start:95 stop:703 length:609 start_codon:yes stop_codon:yes gene_type:complete
MKRYLLIQNLAIAHVSLIVVCNHLVQYSFVVSGVLLSYGMFAYPLIIVLTDLTTRLMGSQSAREVIYLAWIPAWAISMYMSQPRIACASMAAYSLSQLLDIAIFSRVREYCTLNLQERIGLWILPPFISAVFSQAIDTYFFYATAFYASTDDFMATNWLAIATSDYLFKCIITVLFLLPVYGLALRYLLGHLRLRQVNHSVS